MIPGDVDIAKIARLAAVLIPGTAAMPGADALTNLDALVRTAIAACGYPDARLAAMLGALPSELDWDAAAAFAERDPGAFAVASALASAAYYMAPEVVQRLGYPLDRRQPAGVEDFLEEFETGITEPVTARGSRYRDIGGPA